MSSISAYSDRSTLLAEARAEWAQRAQSKADQTGSKVPSTPSDSELIAVDAQLAKEIRAAEAAAEAAAQAATEAATSSTTGTTINILA